MSQSILPGAVKIEHMVDLEDLAESIGAELSEGELQDFICRLDRDRADIDFTKDLVERLLEALYAEGVRLNPDGEWIDAHAD